MFMVLWFTFGYLPIAHMVWLWASRTPISVRMWSESDRTRRQV